MATKLTDTIGPILLQGVKQYKSIVSDVGFKKGLISLLEQWYNNIETFDDKFLKENGIYL
jgi:hypothetical protein